MPVRTGLTMLVTTLRGRVTPEHTLTRLDGVATCAPADVAANKSTTRPNTTIGTAILAIGPGFTFR